jgi:hypothetical protein
MRFATLVFLATSSIAAVAIPTSEIPQPTGDLAEITSDVKSHTDAL